MGGSPLARANLIKSKDITSTVPALAKRITIAILKNASEKKINIIAKEIFSNGRLTNANKKFHQNELIELVTIAKSVNLNLEELSYLWVYQLPFIKICLTGASTITQLDTNLKCIKKKDVEIPSLESFALSTEDYWSTRKLLNWN